MNFQLQNLCNEQNLSFLQLEKKLEIPNARLGMYSRNLNYPNVIRAVKIADFFGCSLDFLTGLSSIRNGKKLDVPRLDLFFQRLDELSSNEKSKSEFSRKCDLARSTIQRWKKRDKFPFLESIFLIAENMNISLDYLVGRTEQKEIL